MPSSEPPCFAPTSTSCMIPSSPWPPITRASPASAATASIRAAAATSTGSGDFAISSRPPTSAPDRPTSLRAHQSDILTIRFTDIANPGGQQAMDAIQLLKNDHKKVEKIFTDLENKTDDRRALFPELDRELTVHAEIEEKVFYPAAKQAEPTRDLVLESIEEHKQIKLVLADLEQTDMRTAEWGAGLKVLKEDVMHHVGEEENDLFPKVQKILSKEQLEDLGTRMEAMKSQLLSATRSR